ncbi:MAG: S1/P1 nuclease [Bacteroidales bacterium]|nr:S1/P1 nuclease [Bacteroidales bacterium]
MKRFVVILLFASFIFGSIDLFAWGQKGHAIVAYIAEKHLTRKAHKKLDAILEGKSLVYYASWMDNIQNSPYFRGGYDRTYTWHYFNVDEGFTPQTMKRNPNGDVLSALNMVIDSLENHQDELSDSVRIDYVRMLIHLVGDMHCPMHAGRSVDKGGNGVPIKWFKYNTNLHVLWDSKLVESVHEWSYTEWQQNIDRCSKSEIKEMSAGTPEDWFTETWKIAVGVYEYTKPNEYYSYKYMYDYAPVVEHQFLVAGYRLAALLNRIFG